MFSLPVIGVDLAAKYSAFVAVSQSGEVYSEGDSFHREEEDFVSDILDAAEDLHISPGVSAGYSPLLVIEDVPHRVTFRIQVKQACRLQGRIVHEARQRGLFDRILFIQPATWQREFGVFKAGTKATREKAEEFGYVCPVLSEDSRFSVDGLAGKERTKMRASARKTQSDYVDAFLITRYIQLHLDEDISSRTQRYDHAT